MPDKKKTPSARSDEKRVTRPPAAKPKGAEPRDAKAVQAFDAGEQLSSFEAAMKQFHGRHMAAARELFERAAAGPERDVANRARLHMAMCDRRLQQATVNLHSAEDYYNYGVALINARKLPEARHTWNGRSAMSRASRPHSLRAGAGAGSGRRPGRRARAISKRAIELEPRNRILARQDADFALMASQPPFDALLYPEKKGW